MAKPRITVALAGSENDGPPQVLLYLNPDGRDLLVKELGRLDEQSDHFHLQAAEWTIDLPLQTIAYESATEEVADDVRVMLRLDEWDAEHFPHVLQGGETDD